jgi:hypothetical protein
MRALFAFTLAAATIGGSLSAQAPAFPAPSDVESYRKTVESVFMKERGGTTPGMAACVMCHTWQTKVRLSLETPATDAGWTIDQSRQNFAVVTKLINTANPETSRLLRKPLAADAGGLGHTGGTYWRSRTDPEYLALLKWIQSLPKDKYVAAAEPELDFAFFQSCVQRVFANPREGHIRCTRTAAGRTPTTGRAGGSRAMIRNGACWPGGCAANGKGPTARSGSEPWCRCYFAEIFRLEK